MAGTRAERKPKTVHVQYTSGKQEGRVATLAWEDANKLHDDGRAIFISNSLFKAAKAGLDIAQVFKSKRARRDDANIKLKTKLHLEKREEKRRKREREKKKAEMKKSKKEG